MSPPLPTGNYLLTLLGNKGPKLESFATTAVITLLCRITKFAWFDEGAAAAAGGAAAPSEIRAVVKETTQFLQATIPHCVIGLKILNELVTEMNYKSKNRTATQQRKVSVSFRDASLLEVFEVSLSMVNQLATRAISFDGIAPDQARRAHDVLLESTYVERERAFSRV